MKETGRNDPCPCGSGKKYKQCCQQRGAPAAGKGNSGATPAPTAIAHYNQGKVFLEQGNPDAAISSYRKALALKPDYAEAYINLGNVLYEQGKLDEAVENFRNALTLKPGMAQAHYNMGNALYAQGKLGEAAESYRKVISLMPGFADAHNNLGLALQMQGKLDDAAKHYRKALASKPNFADAHVNLGNALKELGRLDEAITSYQRALAVRPDLAEAHLSLGNALREQGSLDGAIAQYHKALAFNPDYADAYNNLGDTLKEQGRLDEAVICCRKALALQPDFAGAHNNLGNALNELGKVDAAIECYRKALALRPDWAEAYINLGNAFKGQGEPDSAKESVLYYQKAFSARTKLRDAEDGELSPGLADVYLELTNKCNFHCDFCPSDSLQRTQGYMSMELIRKVYSEVAEKKLAPQINLHLMGEPTLHPDFMEILALGSSSNIKTALVTNGSTMNAKSAPKILDALYGSLTVSLQTPTRETYKHRGDVGLDWDRYIGNIRLLVREHLKRVALKQTIHSTVDLRVMVTRDSKLSANIIQTEEDVSAVMQEWGDFVSGAELELGLPPFQRKEVLAAAMKQTAAKQDESSYPLQQGLKITFWRGFSFANSRLSSDYKIEPLETSKFCCHPFTDVGVLCNGDVTLCCLDYDGQLVVGNVRDDTLEAVIYGERARNLRAAMLSRHPMPPFCQQCLAEAVRSEPVKPINFIIPQ